MPAPGAADGVRRGPNHPGAPSRVRTRCHRGRSVRGHPRGLDELAEPERRLRRGADGLPLDRARRRALGLDRDSLRGPTPADSRDAVENSPVGGTDTSVRAGWALGAGTGHVAGGTAAV